MEMNVTQTLPPAPMRVEIPFFPQGKRLAVTFSFDDGVEEDRRVIDFMNEHGLKGTFNLNSAMMPGGQGGQEDPARIPASDIARVYQGHEVAIHTCTHPYLNRLGPSQVTLEVLQDRMALEDLVGYPVRGMAYPYGAFSPQVIQILKALGIVYCRTTQVADRCFPIDEPLAWPATGHMFSIDAQQQNMAQRFTALYENPRASGVFFAWGHSYEFGRKADRWHEMPALFKPMAAHRDVWYCTNIELFDYEAARQRMVIAANRRTASNPSAVTVTLLVDGKPVDVPPGRVVDLTAAR